MSLSFVKGFDVVKNLRRDVTGTCILDYWNRICLGDAGLDLESHPEKARWCATEATPIGTNSSVTSVEINKPW